MSINDTLEKAQEILARYEYELNSIEITAFLDEILAANYLGKTSSARKDPLTEDEHEILFDAALHLGNERRRKEDRDSPPVSFSRTLKLKLIQNRAKLNNYLTIVKGKISATNVTDIIKTCKLNQNEESELWKLFHSIRPDKSSRTSDELDRILGIYDVIDKMLQVHRRINVLDAGCGVGVGIATLKEKYKKKINAHGVSALMPEDYPGVTYKEADLRKIPFPKDMFHLVYACEVMRYFDKDDYITVLNEISRVLKKGGLFVFNDHRYAGDNYIKFEKTIAPNIKDKSNVESNGTSIYITKL